MPLDHEDTATPAEDFRDGGEASLSREFVLDVEGAIALGDSERIHELVGDLHEADLGALLELLSHEARPRLVELMGADFDFTALMEVGEATREEILDELPVETLIEGVRELESDDAVAILEGLEPKEQAEVLDALPAQERIVLRRSLDYPEDSAGRLMQTTFVAAPPFWTAGRVLDFFRECGEENLPENFFEVFVVDPGYRLLGTVFLDALVRAKPSARLDEIMQEDRRRVNATEDGAEAARLFERYNLVSVPVVDGSERLVGVLTIDDIVDVIQEQASDEILALGGVNPEEELTDNFWWIVRSRFTWLFIYMLTVFITSSVLKSFQAQLEQMVALAVLGPIVAGQGGSSATQTMTVAVRALATRELTSANALRIIFRELAIGAVNGAAFGLLTGIVAATWFQNVGLGPVIGLAMFTNLVAGALGGVVVPLVFDRLKFDPAVSSGPFVTTITDVVGYSAFLTIASLWFHLG
ncbi:magnesium transporter [Methylocystis sp. FS]|uniref:magnesium transporter n=1 Tax=Methylocystis silviterrae TaxID=2743612 RepID=UPI0015824A75|nr:magnesium transporter [Methylocystis silviterrae]NUJ79201.1 magnesium transporter [Methylocystis silviterrae]